MYFPPHSDDAGQIDAVVSGKPRVTPDGKSHILTMGVTFAVPQVAAHDAAVER